MPISKTSFVFDLVKSMTKADKRAFRLYAQRVMSDSDLMYLKLFDVLDKQDELNEKDVKKQLKNLDASSFTNLKRHLYQQILISLRLLYKNKQPNIKIREYIDFAFVLYGKGLYMQALSILEKAKKMAIKHNTDFGLLTIIEFEKTIHSRHITRSDKNLIADLVDASREISNSITNRINLSNVRLQLHKFYAEHGQVKNQSQLDNVNHLFTKELPDVAKMKLGKMEKVYLNQSYVWYYYILNDFKNCKKYAAKWVDIFKSSTELRNRDINLFMRGYHYLLTSLSNLKQTEQYKSVLSEFEQFRKSNYTSLNPNSQILSFLYVHNGRLNLHFLEGTFEEGCENLNRTLIRIQRYKSNLDEHQIMVLYFKIAWMYIGNHQPEKAIKYLNAIIDSSNKTLRNDIIGYSKIMLLMANTDLENYEDLLKLERKFSKILKQTVAENKVQKYASKLFSELSNAPILDRKLILKKYLEKLKALESMEFEKRAFNYLQIIPWIEAKLKNCTISDIVSKKRL